MDQATVVRLNFPDQEKLAQARAKVERQVRAQLDGLPLQKVLQNIKRGVWTYTTRKIIWHSRMHSSAPASKPEDGWYDCYPGNNEVTCTCPSTLRYLVTLELVPGMPLDTMWCLHGFGHAILLHTINKHLYWEPETEEEEEANDEQFDALAADLYGDRT